MTSLTLSVKNLTLRPIYMRALCPSVNAVFVIHVAICVNRGAYVVILGSKYS